MTSRARWNLGLLSCLLVLLGCSGNDAERSSVRPGRGDFSQSPTSQPTINPTGTAAPTKGEPGFEDLPECFGHAATILGGPSDDHIVGTDDKDVIVTAAGNDLVTHLRRGDRVCTGGGGDLVMDSAHLTVQLDLGRGGDQTRSVLLAGRVGGGLGDDRLTVEQAPTIEPGPGDDVVRLLPPTARRRLFSPYTCVWFSRATHPMRINLSRGRARGQGHDRLVDVSCVSTGPLDDRIIGTDLADDIRVGRGHNLVWSRGGNDDVFPGFFFNRPGSNVIYLGDGKDNASGSRGADRIYGGPGNDSISAEGGSDHLEGGPGNDTLYGAGQCETASSAGEGTIDTFGNELFGGPGNDVLTGDLGNDRLDGGPGFDRGLGGYQDHRVDWTRSVEATLGC